LEKKYESWKRKGSVLPMPCLGKQIVVKGYAEKSSASVFVETGTYKGDMVYAMVPCFREVYTIELDNVLFENACRRLACHSNVHMMCGDSAEVLGEILQQVQEPVLFWLDAHYSGGPTAKADTETPIMQELDSVLGHGFADKHVILIDDARCFTGQNDYPTLAALEDYVHRIHPSWCFEVEKDIVRIHSGFALGSQSQV
jgi:hypothetical protein